MEDTFLTAGQFAAMLQIDRHELDRADERGLFVPVKRENNGHRWYALSQVNAWLILQSLQKLGVSEPEIKTMMSAPNDFSGLLHQQQRLINKHSERLTALQEQVSELITANETAQRAVADQVTIVNRAPQDMLVTKPTADAASETALIEAHLQELTKHLDVPITTLIVGKIRPRSDVTDHSLDRLTGVYTPLIGGNAQLANETRSAGRFLILYHHADQPLEAGYQRLLDYADENHLALGEHFYESTVPTSLQTPLIEGPVIRMLVPIRE